jgi:hypothetical protein
MYLIDENKIHSFTTRAQTNTIRLGALEGSKDDFSLKILLLK